MNKAVTIDVSRIAGDDQEKIPTIELAMAAEYERGFRDGARWLLQRQSHERFVAAGLEDQDFAYYIRRRAPWETDPAKAKSPQSFG